MLSFVLLVGERTPGSPGCGDGPGSLPLTVRGARDTIRQGKTVGGAIDRRLVRRAPLEESQAAMLRGDALRETMDSA